MSFFPSLKLSRKPSINASHAHINDSLTDSQTPNFPSLFLNWFSTTKESLCGLVSLHTPLMVEDANKDNFFSFRDFRVCCG